MSKKAVKRKAELKESDIPPYQQAVIRPQAGPQQDFLSSSADIVIYGGAAGGGKTYGLLLETLRHIMAVPNFGFVIFRSTSPQIRNEGGLWDESSKLYPLVGAKPKETTLEWEFPPFGNRVKFTHLQYEKDVHDHQGAQYPAIGFDELTHFSKTQFFYMLSRNRSTCGVRPYIRATCNPDPDSWVAEFITWWIGEDGLPEPSRIGKMRWFYRIGDEIIWGNSKKELQDEYGDTFINPETKEIIPPLSVTFIPASIYDNKELLKADPSYLAKLKALSRVERERLLGGNWKVRAAAGMYFKRHEVTMLDTIPTDVVKWVRRWDLAATEPSETNPNPDWTAGVLMGVRKNGRYVIADCIHIRKKSHLVREAVLRAANNDGFKVRIGISQDPGQAGKDQAESYVRDLTGYTVDIIRESGDKITRADPYASQWQGGNIDVVRGSWNESFFNEHENFGGGKDHDDQVDGGAGAYIMLTGSSLSTWEKLGR